MPQKNQALLIKAFSKVVKDYPFYKLQILGDGPLLTELEQIAKDCGIYQNVDFLGYVEDVSPFIKDASLFVLSSDFEGMPNALMESMALGLPCISTDCSGGGARFLIENNINGVIVPQKDVDILASAMLHVLKDKTFASRIGLEANKICNKLNPNRIYSKWEKYIETIIRKRQ